MPILVKWEASKLEDPDHPPDIADSSFDPTQHPACLEVVNLDGDTPITLYQREESCR